MQSRTRSGQRSSSDPDMLERYRRYRHCGHGAWASFMLALPEWVWYAAVILLTILLAERL